VTRPLHASLTQSARRERDVDLIVDFLNPTGGAPFHNSIADCRREVRHAIADIRDPLPITTAAVERRQLAKFVAKLDAALAALRDLPDGCYLTRLNAEAVYDQDIAECRQRIAALPVERSGGAGGKLGAERRRVAAERAFDLLVEHGGQVPTLTKAGRYITLANMLFEAATGRKSADLSRACAKYLARIRDDDGCRADELRRRRVQ
jgi:hypothetical protein